METTLLPADLIREILKGHESMLHRLSSANEAAKQEIANMLCPQCRVPLQPRPHPNPEILFSTGGVTYRAYCPACKNSM